MRDDARRAMRWAVWSVPLVLAAVGGIMGLFVIPWIEISYFDAELEPFAVGYHFYYRALPTILIVGLVTSAVLAREENDDRRWRQLVVVTGVEAVIMTVCLVMTMPR